MKQLRFFTAIIEQDEDWFVALCPELDIASQGRSVEDARGNLAEAIELFFEVADAAEIEQRLHSDIYVTQVGVPVG
ncbi:MAG: type II toxin-antitoxin system HicB family antitoxin [Anaerolinea sp.]|nr:type II toxin-antitoxin system HicB family antitoxin [Anaerolinea sp.]